MLATARNRRLAPDVVVVGGEEGFTAGNIVTDGFAGGRLKAGGVGFRIGWFGAIYRVAFISPEYDEPRGTISNPIG